MIKRSDSILAVIATAIADYNKPQTQVLYLIPVLWSYRCCCNPPSNTVPDSSSEGAILEKMCCCFKVSKAQLAEVIIWPLSQLEARSSPNSILQHKPGEETAFWRCLRSPGDVGCDGCLPMTCRS